MIVYRLETESGLGPYSLPKWGPLGWTQPPSFLVMERADFYGNPDTPHPAPGEDGLSIPGAWRAILPEEYCGFESLEALAAWFYHQPHDPAALDRMGLRVAAYHVHGRQVRKGGKQLVFKRSHATLALRSTNVYIASTLVPDEILK